MTDQTQTTTEPVARWIEKAATPFIEGGLGDELQKRGDAYLADYVLSTDGADYEPNEFERALLADAFAGLLMDEALFGPIRAILAALTTPQPLAVSLDREAVARVIDSAAWEHWDAIRRPEYGSYDLSGEPEGRTEDPTCRRWALKEYANPSCAKSLTKADAILALAAPAEVNGHVASALLWFGSQHNLELSYGYEVDGEGDDGWQVHSVNGGRNDREWTRLSFGHDTPIKAIAACLPAAPTGGRS